MTITNNGTFRFAPSCDRKATLFSCSGLATPLGPSEEQETRP